MVKLYDAADALLLLLFAHSPNNLNRQLIRERRNKPLVPPSKISLGRSLSLSTGMHAFYLNFIPKWKTQHDADKTIPVGKDPNI